MLKDYIIISRSNQKAKNGSSYAILKVAAQKGEAHSFNVWDLDESAGPAIGDIVSLDMDVLKGIKFPKMQDVGFFRSMRHATPADALYSLIPRPVDKAKWDTCIDALLTHCTDPQLMAFIGSERDELYANYSTHPAATSVHHAFQGGLLNHTYELLNMLLAIIPTLPPLKLERCIIAIMFHDWGKLKEYNPDTFEPTEYKHLMGHVYISAHVLHNKLNKAGINNQETIRIVHCVLAHHGQLEYGSPVAPCSAEAIVVNHLDNLSAKTYIVDEAADMEKVFALGTTVVK
mgnify:CR=1 FL=1